MRRKPFRASLTGSPRPIALPVQEPAGISLAPGISIPLQYANRHGLITGQTGTGKSVTLMRLAEGFADAGAAVFLADVKGDLSRMSGVRAVSFLDAFGTGEERFTAAPADLGPDLFARALDLSDAQAGTIELTFHLAAREGRRLDTAGDLLLILGDMLARQSELNATLGQVSPASVGVIRRAMLRLNPNVISAPSFDVANLLVPGRVSMLRADRLIQSPRLYAALLMYVLDQLEARLPEIGDRPVPRLAFFFDEAHLLFHDVPPALLARIERTVRLIRSKGVGVYFASQRPGDIPAGIREQLAHQVAHDRAHGVGRATVETLAQDGRPLASCGPVPIYPAASLAAPVPPQPVQDWQDAPNRQLACYATAPLDNRPAAVSEPAPWIASGAALAVLCLAAIGLAALLGASPVWVGLTIAGCALAAILRFPVRARRR